MRARPVKLVLAVLAALAASAATLTAPATAEPVAKPPQPSSSSTQHWGPRPRAGANWTAPRIVPEPNLPRVRHLDPRLQRSSVRSTRPVPVAVHGSDVRAVTAAVHRAGGRVLGATRSDVSAVVPPSALTTLAGTGGVTAVTPPVQAKVNTQTSEGVQATNAAVWQQTTGFPGKGQGVKVAVVDAGFGSLSTANLPVNQTVTGDHCANVNATDHGTAVAEIVHEMAPLATLLLYCVDDNIGFQQAAGELQAAGATVVNSSLSFPGDSRGDGTGSAASAATTVENARKAGILWVTSAGNAATDHWGGSLVDVDGDRSVELKGTSEADSIGVDGGEAEVWLRWDQWPSTALGVGIEYRQLDAARNYLGPAELAIRKSSAPVVCVAFNSSAPGGCDAVPLDPNAVGVEVGIYVPANTPALRYDLSYYGSVSYNYLSCRNITNNVCDGPDPVAAAGSIEEPASSPYALAVGAADVGNAQLEDFSSQGPTVDGRSKPDIVGPDGTSSSIYGARGTPNGGFFGTSASAPHVAGAAALVKGATPSLDAAQIEAFLEGRTSQHRDVPDSLFGYGQLALGSPANVTAVTGSGYVPLASPVRTFDTRFDSSPGGHPPKPMAGREIRTIQLPSPPPGASAVAINLAGTQATGSTYLTVAPSSPSARTSNLNLNSIDATAAVYAVVPIGPGGTIAVRNSNAPTHVFVDTLGYYVKGSGVGFTSRAPQRILDTRSSGGRIGGTPRDVDPKLASLSIPSNASALVVNVTAVDETGTGYLSVSPTGTAKSSTLNYYKSRTRANLTVVTLDANKHFKVLSGGGSLSNVVLDVAGYFSPTSTGTFVPLTPVRIADTRTGNGGRHTPLLSSGLGQDGTVTYSGSGIYQVPYAATALMTGVVPIPAATSVESYLTVYPANPRPPTSSINFAPGRLVPNAVLTSLSPAAPSTRTFSIFNSQGRTDVAVDLFGYFIG